MRQDPSPNQALTRCPSHFKMRTACAPARIRAYIYEFITRHLMTISAPLKAFLIEDHYVVREGLQRMLELGNIHIVGATGTLYGAIEALQQLPAQHIPDVLILDLNLPDVTALDSIAILKQHFPERKILIFSMRHDPQTVSAAYKHGILAYVTKDAKPEELLAAIDAVSRGQEWIMPSVQKEIALQALGRSSYTSPFPNPCDTLTPKEYETFIAMAQGMQLAELMPHLKIGKGTLARRIYDIRHKLKCARTDFHRIATMHNLL